MAAATLLGYTTPAEMNLSPESLPVFAAGSLREALTTLLETLLDPTVRMGTTMPKAPAKLQVGTAYGVTVKNGVRPAAAALAKPCWPRPPKPPLHTMALVPPERPTGWMV